MKNNIVTLFAIGSLAALVSMGCKKQQESEPAPPANEPPAMQNIAPDVQETVTETVTEVTETAKKTVNEASNKAQELITKAQTLVNEKDYSGAMELINELKSMELTPEQQKLVDGLKATAQKAMQSHATSEGTKALGNLLGGQK